MVMLTEVEFLNRRILVVWNGLLVVEYQQYYKKKVTLKKVF